jgi:hypothetical protein
MEKPVMSNLRLNKYSKKFFRIHPERNFKINIDTKDADILKKLDDRSQKISELFYVSKGAELHNTQKGTGKGKFIYKTFKKNFKPYIEGKNFSKYKTKETLFLDYKPEKHKAPCFKELFDNKKIIAKNIIGRGGLQMILDEKGLYNNDALINAVPYHFLGGLDYPQVKSISKKDIQNSKKVSLKYVLGCLNSITTNYYHKKLLSNNLHFYPSHMREMPVPDESKKDSTKKIENLVTNIITNKANGEKTEEFEKEIDELVMDLYELTDEEKEIIRNNS